jgi:indole-3-glycerol phosphate synthase
MVRAIPDILARIVESKRGALPLLRSNREPLERRALERSGYRDFRAALTAHPPAIIAEIKKASPSKGALTGHFDPTAIARKYAAGGAAALSVMTDEEFFQGSLSDLEAARAAVTIPVLRKDFTLDEIHVVEAAAHGADAILLIAALLEEAELRNLREAASRYRMAALVEVHDDAELDAAIASGAQIIGVNNRNLHTFEVTLETSLRLAPGIPKGVIRVSESGIDSREAITRLGDAGFQAFLVGEHLMRAAEPDRALRALLK